MSPASQVQCLSRARLLLSPSIRRLFALSLRRRRLDPPHESSSGGDLHPSALSEPDVRLSPHPAPTLQPPAARPPPASPPPAPGRPPCCHGTNRLGSRQAMRPSQCMAARSRRRNRVYFRCAHFPRASVTEHLNAPRAIEPPVVVQPAPHHRVRKASQILQALVVPGGRHPPAADGLPD